MDNSLQINNNEIFLVKSKDDRMDMMLARRSVILGNTMLDAPSKLNSIEVDNILTDHFPSDIQKQIIVEKMDDFIQEGQFGDLNIVNGDDSLPEPTFHSQNGNITIVPNVFRDSIGETHIITDQEGELDASQTTTNFFEDDHDLEEVTSKVPLKTCNNEMDNVFTTEGICIKKEPPDEVTPSPSRLPDPLPSSSLTNIRKPRISWSNQDKPQIRVDKDDPRCRLHFVKFMKKDGKTIKIWECGICGKEFIHQYTLMRHLPTHTDERNYKCKHCGKAFRQMSTLAQHKATHSEFRPYVCDICQKTFSRVSTLISHKKIHTESKIHVCHICGKGFHQKGNLKNHFFTHTNERPYKCDVCGRGFNQTSNLQCHKLKTHLQRGGLSQLVTNNKYKCSRCSESFTRRAQLRHHEEYIHNVKTSGGKRPISPAGRRGLISAPSSTLLKKKMGNIRIIQIPSTDGVTTDTKTGILIDPIDTKAMHKRLSQGLTPFALLKPAKASPVVVKVQLCEGSRHMLVPASASELKLAGKFSVTSQVDGNRTVQIKVPVVATIYQRVDQNGQVHMDVEPPSDEETDPVPEEKLARPMCRDLQQSSAPPILSTVISPAHNADGSERSPTTADPERCDSTIVQHFIINPSAVKPVRENLLREVGDEDELSGIPLELATPHDIEYMIPSHVSTPHLIEVASSQDSTVDLLATAVNLTNEATIKEDANSGVHYLRPTENHDEYEVVEHDDRTLFTNSQGVMQQLKPLLDENEPVTVDQAHLTALMDVLQTAGYELQTEDETAEGHQIIVNSVGDTIILHDQQVQMVIDDPSDLSSVDVNSIQIDDVGASTLSLAVQHPQ